MPERRKRITEKLSELHENIQGGQPLDSELEEPLREALGRVEQVVSEEGEDEDDTLGETLGDLALRLEVSHPELTGILNRISELLAGAGI